MNGISKYKAINYYRKYSHEKYRTSDIENHVIQDKISIEEYIIHEVEASKVMGLINLLKEPDKSIFIMKFLADMAIMVSKKFIMIFEQ